MLINEHPSLVHDMMQTDPSDTLCRKDIGKAQRLRKWSRGHQFIVRGGGHIDAWQPLYRLEVNTEYYRAYCKIGVIPYSLDVTPPSFINPCFRFAAICCEGIFISNLSPPDQGKGGGKSLSEYGKHPHKISTPLI